MSNRRKIKAAAAAFTEAYQCGHCGARASGGPGGPVIRHQPTCPAFTGAADAGASRRRAAADASEQTGVVVIDDSLLAGARQGPFTEIPTGPRVRDLTIRFIMAAPDLHKCRHLPSGPPDAGDGPCWLASSPEMIRCMACTMAVSQRQAGTAADTTCDSCQRSSAEIDVYQVDCNGVLVIAGLCPECSDADKAEAR